LLIGLNVFGQTVIRNLINGARPIGSNNFAKNIGTLPDAEFTSKNVHREIRRTFEVPSQQEESYTARTFSKDWSFYQSYIKDGARGQITDSRCAIFFIQGLKHASKENA
jgi:hypothetical protein